MPTYEYSCSKCAHQFEVSGSIKDAPLVICPKELCPQKRWGKGKVKRGVGGGTGLIFKGTGFYITDYRSDKYKEAAKKDAAASKATSTPAAPAAAPAPAASPKTDSKPSAK